MLEEQLRSRRNEPLPSQWSATSRHRLKAAVHSTLPHRQLQWAGMRIDQQRVTSRLAPAEYSVHRKTCRIARLRQTAMLVWATYKTKMHAVCSVRRKTCRIARLRQTA